MNELDYIIKPITLSNLEAVNQDCWQSRDAQLKLLSRQEILGFGAFIDGVCVGSLHCYKIESIDIDDSLFPNYARNRLEDWPLGWPLLALKAKGIVFSRPIWGHACFHVGRLVNTHHSDATYISKGIGTALLEASIDWAKEHNYAAVVAHGGSKKVSEYNMIMGCLPYTTYERYGFKVVAIEENGQKAPWWTTVGESWDDEKLQAQLKAAYVDNIDFSDIAARLMVLNI